MHHITPEQKAASPFFENFWDNRGWGFGLSIITRRDNVADVPGRFGWDGGYSTSGYTNPKEEMIGTFDDAARLGFSKRSGRASRFLDLGLPGYRRLTTHVRQKRETAVIRIKLTSVMVDDQAKAQKFYTEVLGFVTKRDIPMGAARWLTVVSPAEPEGTELLLEPNSGVEEAPGFQKALLNSGIPITAFAVDDIEAEYDRLKALGVEFRGPPSKPDVGPSNVLLNDTCGNLIQLFQA
jgi:catechol 2,3-dioxygenase-like lactoylglutathione lyase family enzyme